MANVHFGPADVGFTPSTVEVRTLAGDAAETFDAGGASAPPVVAETTVEFYAPHGTYRLVLHQAGTTDLVTRTVTLQDAAPAGGSSRTPPSQKKAALLNASGNVIGDPGGGTHFIDFSTWTVDPSNFGNPQLDIDVSSGSIYYPDVDTLYLVQFNIVITSTEGTEVGHPVRVMGLGSVLSSYFDAAFYANEAYCRDQMLDYTTEPNSGMDVGIKYTETPGGITASGSIYITEL